MDENLIQKISEHLGMEKDEIIKILKPNAERLKIDLDKLTLSDLRELVSDMTQDMLVHLKEEDLSPETQKSN